MMIRTLLFGVVTATILLAAGCSLEPPRSSEQGASYQQSTPSQLKAVAIAKQMIGSPYRYGGSSPKGFDCSGLVYYSYSRAGYRISRDSRSQIAQTIHIDPRDMRPGDLLFFNIDGSTTHIGIYTGNGQFIHAPSSGKRVSYASMSEQYWRDHFVRAGRLR